MEEDEDEEDEGEEEEEDVVEDYYDSYKVDDYNEETPTEPSSDKAASEKEVSSDMKCKPTPGLLLPSDCSWGLSLGTGGGGGWALIESINATWKFYLPAKLANRGKLMVLVFQVSNSPEPLPSVCRSTAALLAQSPVLAP